MESVHLKDKEKCPSSRPVWLFSMDTVRKNKKTVVKSTRYQQCRRQKKSPTRKNPEDPSLLPSLGLWLPVEPRFTRFGAMYSKMSNNVPNKIKPFGHVLQRPPSGSENAQPKGTFFFRGKGP